ncbi:hypothetical protein NDU88_001131 [Pleurodeles waltl]|uniref:Uncharacterized protein n=1 Tax=Pleurodeles waltl TaxID=8319 RepID=A0AAV7MIV7_PLEWA|nr:hypothetical protein NDU88_001131 [Pleurodeles waltl]
MNEPVTGALSSYLYLFSRGCSSVLPESGFRNTSCVSNSIALGKETPLDCVRVSRDYLEKFRFLAKLPFPWLKEKA